MNDFSDKKKKKLKVSEPEVKYAKRSTKKVSDHNSSTNSEVLNLNYIELKNAIAGFSKLQSNWDSYNADPISKQAITEAENVLVFLNGKKYLAKSIINVFPMRDGGIQFEFDNESNSSELEISPDGKLTFISFDNEGNFLKQEQLFDVEGLSTFLEDFNYAGI